MRFVSIVIPFRNEESNIIRCLNSIMVQVDFFIVAIGNNKVREQVYNIAKEILEPAIVIHPSAIIGSDVKIGAGSVILANAFVSAIIRENVIVNARVVVDHDCQIANNIHLSIGTMVGSNSIINNGYLSKIGESINAFSNVG